LKAYRTAVSLTVKELTYEGEKTLKDSGIENARFDAEALLGFVIGASREKLFLDRDSEVDDTHVDRYIGFVKRRASGEPLQYITGEQWFMGHRFYVNPSVLIPRPETEIMAEKAIEYLRTNDGAKRVLDLCTGSGVLAISIALACPAAKIIASDISADALAVAERNARELGIRDRIEFTQGDLFGYSSGDTSVDRRFLEDFDLIITNPPYIRTEDLKSLPLEIRGHEPALALDGGADGLDFYRRIAADTGQYLSRGGCIFAEIGHDQANAISALFRNAGSKNIEVYKDHSGLDRIVQCN
jgi:release factor glutamine methyltransferase